jgi:hypothetical protein
VIADMATEDDAFIDDAAKRGIFAYVKHGSQPELAHALDISLRRYAEFSRIHGALGRRALIEQAKGILMERRAIRPTPRSPACANAPDLRDRHRRRGGGSHQPSALQNRAPT